MIISHKHKFIFIKTNKTAGTSIEIALSKFCGPDDIITPISHEDEQSRSALGYPGPQNYQAPFRSNHIPEKKENADFYNHISAREITSRIDPGVWQNYLKFCVERNPWDRVVSLFYWMNRSEQFLDFSSFVNSPAPLRLKKFGLQLYTTDGEIVVDKVCRFENLDKELEQLRLHIGLPDSLELPRAKSRFRKNSSKLPYQNYYNENDKFLIQELFSQEIHLFNYKF